MLQCSATLTAEESGHLFEKTLSTVESLLLDKFREMEKKIENNTEKIRINKEKALAFQERQIGRIGIENIRGSRIQKLYREKEKWTRNFESSRQIVPSLTCLTIMKISK
jgi:hypothetical protein